MKIIQKIYRYRLFNVEMRNNYFEINFIYEKLIAKMMILDSNGIVIEDWFGINLHSETCQEIDFHPNIPWIASAGWDNHLKIFDVNRRLIIYEHQMDDNVRYVQFSPDGQFLAVSTVTTISVFRVNVNLPRRSLEKIKDFSNNGQNCWCVAWSPNGKYFAFGLFDGTISIFEIGTWTELRKMELTIKTIVHIAFSPSSGFLAATGSKENQVIIIDVRGMPEIWKVQHTIPNLPYEGRKCIWSKDGKYLFVALWGTESFVYNSNDWTVNTTINSEDKGLGGDISNDQQVLGLASESGHYVFYKLNRNNEKWEPLGNYHTEDSFPWDFKWSPHGQWIAANFHDGRLHLMRYQNINFNV